MPPTRHVQLKRKGGKVVNPYDVTVTRAVQRGGWDLPASPFANPFSVASCGGSNEVACAKFEQHLDSRPDLLAQLPKLRGLRLGCFCAESERFCHAKILARRADESVTK